MAGEEERTVEERDAPQGPKDEMVSVMYVWSGCHREEKDGEESHI